MSRIRKLITLLILTGAVTATACKTGGPIPTPDEVKDCAVESAKSQFYDVLPRVRTILASGGNKVVIAEELSRLVGRFGITFITCVVERIGGESAASLAVYQDDPINLRIYDNASTWLSEHGAR